MAWWDSMATDLLWPNAVGLIPLALVAAVFCRWVPARPATRHAVWLVVLLGLVVPPALPRLQMADLPVDLTDPVPHGRTSAIDGSSLASASPPGFASDCTSAAPHPLERTDPQPAPLPESAGRQTCPSQPRTEPRVPDRLAPAPGSVGRLFHTADEPDPHWRPEDFATLPPAEFAPGAGPTEPRVSATMIAGAEPASRAAPAEADSPGLDEPADQSASRWRLTYGGLARLVASRDAIGAAIGGPLIPSGVWLIGIAALLLTTVGRGLWFRRRVRAAIPASAAVTDVVDRAAATLGLRRVPQTLTLEDRVSPVVWCPPFVGRPRLILPTELWSQLDDLGRRAVILHELAHLRRRDHWVRWVETLVGSLYWWNPLVWWIRRRLDEESELCCDAWVTWLLPGGRRAYAQALLKTKQYVCRNKAVVPAGGIGVTTGRARRFARRLTMVMTQRTTPKLSVPGIGLALLLAAVGWMATPAQSSPPEPSTADGLLARAEPGEVQAGNPTVLLAGGDERGLTHHSDDEQAHSHREDLEHRLDRLEHQMQQLAEKLDRLGSSGTSWAGRPFLTPAAPAPMPQPPVPPVPAPTLSFLSEETVVRSYHLPPEKLELLTVLMVRPDVPVLVEPGKEQITVHGTKAQHATFQRFVDLIEPQEEVNAYPLSAGKLEALGALMVRPDVPVRVKPGKDQIEVRGTGVEQSVFAAFVDMIHPAGEAEFLEEFLRAVPGEGEIKKVIKGRVKERKNRAKERAKTHRSGARSRYEEARGLSEQVRSRALGLTEHLGKLRQQGQALRQQADQLKLRGKHLREQSERIQHQADELRKRAEKLGARARKAARSKERADLEAEAQALLESAQPLVDLAVELGEKARALAQEARDNEEQARQVDWEAQAVEEEAHNAGERAEETASEAEVPNTDTSV